MMHAVEQGDCGMNQTLLLGCTLVCLPAGWLTVAYGVARQRTGLRSVQTAQLQWFLTALLFGYPAAAGWSGGQVPLLPLLLLVPAAGAAALYWRTDPQGATHLARRYSRGWLDVALLRKPNAELKRRVRTKGR
jgi:hypothetical protein